MKGLAMNRPKTHHPLHWHRRAEQLRTMAEGTRTSDERNFLFQIADEYDFLASRVEEHSPSQTNSDNLIGGV
jgi:hypothetical protein